VGLTVDVVLRIQELKKERNAIILAHNYQNPEIQDVADFCGDSLGLSRQAAQTDADVIVFCGVSFMAETAKILSPQKTVILPEKMAGCPMADMIDADELRQLKAQHPGAKVVCYVNSSAEVKAESDSCCTSANAVKVVEAMGPGEIIFVPDRNLGSWVAKQLGRDLILWDGYCLTHHRLRPQDVEAARNLHPDAPVLVHPECRPEVVEVADAVESTEGMIRFAKQTPAQEILVGTEMGMIHRLEREAPQKKFFLIHPGLICPNMKMTTLDKLLSSLSTLSPQIEVPEGIRVRAKQALDRMLAL
jgi:quinolinate synthase